MRARFSLLGLAALLAGLGVASAAGCSSTPLTAPGGTGGTGGGAPIGVSTGGTGVDGGIPCGSAVCGAGEYCCNAGCGICAPIGSACVAGCPVDGGPASVTPIDGGPVSDGGSICADLQAQYEAALVAAGSCTPGAPDQCGQLVRSALQSTGACDANCTHIYVNDASGLNTIATLYDQNCADVLICLPITCDPPIQPTCQADGNGGGHCVLPPI